MVGDTREENDQDRRGEEAALSARLRRLGEGLEQSGARRPPDPVGFASVDRPGFARGFRLSTEFVAGVLFGAMVGWAVDHWFKTSPGGLIGFTLLGFAAAVVNLVRTSNVNSGGATKGENKRRPN
jgi:ATP synthase protein I